MQHRKTKKLMAAKAWRATLLLATLGSSLAAYAASQARPSITIACTAPASVLPGSSISISCSGTSEQNRPLTYTFSATAGTLTPHGAMAVLSLTGVTAPQVVVIATVRDDKGASNTQRLTLGIKSAFLLPQTTKMEHLPLPITHAAIAPGPHPTTAIHPMPVAPATASAEKITPPPPPVAVPVQPDPVPAQTAQPVNPVAAETVQPAVAPASLPDAKPATHGDEDIVGWVNGLPYGHITDNIASFPSMRLGVPYTVTVTIGGSDVAIAASAGSTAPAPLKVSKHMDVELTSAGSPDDFTIVPVDPAQNPRLIVSNASTTWSWTVTPKNLGSLKLDVAAYVLYGDKQENRVSYETYNRSVTVKSVTLWGYLKDGLEFVLQNPGASLKYMLPGGGGAAIIALIIAWWRKRKNSGTAKGDDKAVKKAE
jgi:hypothetical protein